MTTKPSFSTKHEHGRERGKVVLPLKPASIQRSSRRRRTSPESGRALEILGHAIEYLADEHALTIAQAGRLDSGDPRVEAIQLLMSLNRQVYYSCPTIEPVFLRLAAWLFGPSVTPPPKQTSF